MIVDLSDTPWRAVMLHEQRGIWCLVDAIDWEWIAREGFLWNIGWHRDTRWKYYAKRNTGAARSTVYLHREIMLRASPRGDCGEGIFVDHINGQSLDNRRVNLRWATKAENDANRKTRNQIPELDAIVGELIALRAQDMRAGVLTPAEAMPF